MRSSGIAVALAAAVCVASTPLWADVAMHSLFTENAVLQRGISLPVYGTATDGEKVTVQFCGQTASTVATQGKWMVRLKSVKAGGPYDMVVTGNNKITVKNLLVGDVWVCSGQSNMQLGLETCDGGKEAMANSANLMIRLYQVPLVPSDTPVPDVKASWQKCSPDTLRYFTGVGYFFGKSMLQSENVPIGLINSSYGGTRVETWTSPSALDPKDREQWPEVRKGWPDWAQRPNDPSVLYNGMIYPLIPYGIKGVIWYQGESNAGYAAIYEQRFITMINNWRKDWGQGNFPFLFVQIAPFSTIVKQPEESAWAELREAQRLTALHCPKTAMAVITDVGDPDNIHPIWKQPVGERLAMAARAIGYKRKVAYRGPEYKGIKIAGNAAIVSFNFAGKGLVAKGGPLTGWTIAGADKKWHNAEAVIVGKSVKVSSSEVPAPVAVRYGWANCPIVNLWNVDGLPASPFRTDDWTLITAANSK
ncbi:MAG: sialate O-acetylesterase [Armatimonadota bacterium]